jgi:hypothetical protein
MANKCPDIEPMKEPLKCGDIQPMSLETRRHLLERQAWIANVKRMLGMSDDEAQKAWLKIKTEKE